MQGGKLHYKFFGVMTGVYATYKQVCHATCKLAPCRSTMCTTPHRFDRVLLAASD